MANHGTRHQKLNESMVATMLNTETSIHPIIHQGLTEIIRISTTRKHWSVPSTCQDFNEHAALPPSDYKKPKSETIQTRQSGHNK